MKLKWNFDEWYDFGDRLGTITKFDAITKQATRELAKVLHECLFENTPVKTGNLCAGWGGGENYTYTVKKVKNGFEVTLKNEVPYAVCVNNGHYSYNQYNVGGDPYVVKNRTVPYTQGKNEPTFVFGRFFVENSILDTEEQLEAVVFKELEKWFRWCVNGK